MSNITFNNIIPRLPIWDRLSPAEQAGLVAMLVFAIIGCVGWIGTFLRFVDLGGLTDGWGGEHMFRFPDQFLEYCGRNPMWSCRVSGVECLNLLGYRDYFIQSDFLLLQFL
ncbi:hypothetical protein PTI98_006903 [Pleurotus ostreatus]|nr:hypothetical protein PTI98_006903 [Pleurotus ostreatus]